MVQEATGTTSKKKIYIFEMKMKKRRSERITLETTGRQGTGVR